METEREKDKIEEEKVLLEFLKQTKKGKYVKIDKSSLAFSRLGEQREEPYCEEEYYYGVR